MDRQEFTRRVLAVEGRLYRISRGMLRDAQDQMDAVQEAVLKAWRNLDRLRREEFFETWLMRILINECHNIQNARKRIVPLERVPERAAPAADANVALYEALMALDEVLRLPLLLNCVEGYRVREIARILHIPEGTVKSRMARAKCKLRELLEEDDK